MSNLLGSGLLGPSPRLGHPGYKSGVWYGPDFVTTVANTTAVAANTLYAHHITIWRRVTIAQLGLRIGTSTPGVRGKLALYANGGDYSPGALVAEISADLDMGGNLSQAQPLLGGSKAVEAGEYWLASCFDGAAQPTLYSTAAIMAGGAGRALGASSAAGPAGVFASSNVNSRFVRTAALPYVAGQPFMPNTFGAGAAASGAPGAPLVAFLVA